MSSPPTASLALPPRIENRSPSNLKYAFLIVCSPTCHWKESVNPASTAADVPVPNGSSALLALSGVFSATVVVPGLEGAVVLAPPLVVPLIARMEPQPDGCTKLCWRQ